MAEKLQIDLTGLVNMGLMTWEMLPNDGIFPDKTYLYRATELGKRLIGAIK